jgi:hypothetical protein
LKNNYKDLVESIQKTFGSTLLYSKDCLLLSDDIYDNIQVRISAQTLRRLMNFIDDGVKISNTSLNYLAVYCGYENYKDFIKQYNDNTKIVDSKDIKYIKLFYSINPKNPSLDENYHNASKNIAKLLLRDNDLLNSTSTFLAKNKSAQIFFYERFPHIDALSAGYSIHLSKYLKEKNNYESQLFGNCLLYFGFAMSNNVKRSFFLKLINAIPEEQIYHPFPLARKFASNILEHYLNKNELELEKWINLTIKEASEISKWKREFINFPYFQFIIADVFNLIERPVEAEEILKICELDYKRLPGFTLDEGYIEALDLIKAINLFQLGKVSESKRILKRVNSKDIIFIMHDYFLIQRLIIELKMITSKTSRKYQLKETELNRLINKTKFYFFLDYNKK